MKISLANRHLLIVVGCFTLMSWNLGAQQANEHESADQLFARAGNYYRGDGVRQDYTEAFRWFKKSAALGNVNAQAALATCYIEGHGTIKDAVRAKEWLEKASLQGHPGAQYNLGYLYATGQGVNRDDSEAFKWYFKAADQGVASAQVNLAFLYLNGRSVAKDETAAVNWFKKAAAKGEPKAQYQLGYALENGRGVPKDTSEAVKWYMKSAEQEIPDAQYQLAACYESGTGVAKNMEKADLLYQMAVNEYKKGESMGNNHSLIRLGDCSFYGRGLPQNYEKAFELFKRAEMLHADEEVSDRLKQTERHLTESQILISTEKAMDWLVQNGFFEKIDLPEDSPLRHHAPQPGEPKDRPVTQAELDALKEILSARHFDSEQTGKVDINQTSSQGGNPDETAIALIADSIKIVPSEGGWGNWVIGNRFLCETQNSKEKGEPSFSPDGKSVHYGRAKLNNKRASIITFHLGKNDSLESTNWQQLPEKVIELISNSGKVPSAATIDGCWLNPIRWTDGSNLLISAYAVAQGPGGFQVNNYQCVWNVEIGDCRYIDAFRSEDENVTLNDVVGSDELQANGGDIHPEPVDPYSIVKDSTIAGTMSGGPMAQGETALNSISAFLDAYYKTFVNGTPEKWAGMFTENAFYCYANTRVSRSKLIAECNALRSKWPSRTITRQAANFELSNNGNSAILTFSFNYTYTNTSGKTTSGISNIKLGLGWVMDRWLIDSFEETVSKLGASPSGHAPPPPSSASNYSGTVGKLTARFSLVWKQNGQVEGSYFHPTRDPDHKYFLKGSNAQEGKLELTEYDNGTPSATLKLSKETRNGKVTWSGIMFNEDGRQLPVLLIRD